MERRTFQSPLQSCMYTITWHFLFWWLYSQRSSGEAGMPAQLLIRRVCKLILRVVFLTTQQHVLLENYWLIKPYFKGGFSQLMQYLPMGSWKQTSCQQQLHDIQDEAPKAWVTSSPWQSNTGMHCVLTRWRHGLHQYIVTKWILQSFRENTFRMNALFMLIHKVFLHNNNDYI